MDFYPFGFFFCVLRFLACDCPVSGYSRLVCFDDFSDLSYSCHLQEEINFCLLPSTKVPLTAIAISLTIIIFVFAGQAGRARSNIVTYINSSPTQVIDGTENSKPIRSFQNAQRNATNLAVKTDHLLLRGCFSRHRRRCFSSSLLL